MIFGNSLDRSQCATGTPTKLASRIKRERLRRRSMVFDTLEDRRLLSTFTVTNTLDDGSIGSLRWAVGQADSTAGANVIDFDNTVFSTPQTITLTSGQLELSNTTGAEAITGPAAGVTVSGNNASRVFQVDRGATVRPPIH